MTMKSGTDREGEAQRLKAQLEMVESRAVELARLCKAQSEGMSRLSFEARTLLDGMVVFTDFLRPNADRQENEYLDIIRRSAQELLRLIGHSTTTSVSISTVAATFLKPVDTSSPPSQISSDPISQQPHPAPLTSSKNPLSNKKILVVDDNSLNQVLARKILTKHECDVLVAATAEEGLSLLQKNQFDLVLMDIQLPGMNGWEATQVMKSTPSLSGIPVIAMTAMAFPGDEEKCAAAGMDGYVSKPLDTKLLLKTMADLLAKRVMRTET